MALWPRTWDKGELDRVKSRALPAAHACHHLKQARQNRRTRMPLCPQQKQSFWTPQAAIAVFTSPKVSAEPAHVVDDCVRRTSCSLETSVAAQLGVCRQAPANWRAPHVYPAQGRGAGKLAALRRHSTNRLASALELLRRRSLWVTSRVYLRGEPVCRRRQAHLSNKAGSVSRKLCAWLLGREAWWRTA